MFSSNVTSMKDGDTFENVILVLLILAIFIVLLVLVSFSPEVLPPICPFW